MRRASATLLAALLLLQSVLVPLLDGADRFRGPVIESEHGATSCGHGHDHSVCTQFGANRLLSSEVAKPHGTSLELVFKNRWVRDGVASLIAASLHHSRAPPLA